MQYLCIDFLAKLNVSHFLISMGAWFQIFAASNTKLSLIIVVSWFSFQNLTEFGLRDSCLFWCYGCYVIFAQAILLLALYTTIILGTFLCTLLPDQQNCTISWEVNPLLPAYYHQRTLLPPISPGHFPGELAMAKTKSVRSSFIIKQCTYYRHVAGDVTNVTLESQWERPARPERESQQLSTCKTVGPRMSPSRLVSGIHLLLNFKILLKQWLINSWLSRLGIARGYETFSGRTHWGLRLTSLLYQSTVAYWYAICFVLGGPGFKSLQGR